MEAARADDAVEQRPGKAAQHLDRQAAELRGHDGRLVVFEMHDVWTVVDTDELGGEPPHRLTRREAVDEVGAATVGKPERFRTGLGIGQDGKGRPANVVDALGVLGYGDDWARSPARGVRRDRENVQRAVAVKSQWLTKTTFAAGSSC